MGTRCHFISYYYSVSQEGEKSRKPMWPPFNPLKLAVYNLIFVNTQNIVRLVCIKLDTAKN